MLELFGASQGLRVQDGGSMGFALVVGDSRSEMVWRSGIFEFCTGRFALVAIEVVAGLRFTFCLVRRGPTLACKTR
jgi:hypothetical protein